MTEYVKTYDLKSPTAETKAKASKGSTVRTPTAADVAPAFFDRGPIYTSGPGGLITQIPNDAGARTTRRPAAVRKASRP